MPIRFADLFQMALETLIGQTPAMLDPLYDLPFREADLRAEPSAPGVFVLPTDRPPRSRRPPSPETRGDRQPALRP